MTDVAARYRSLGADFAGRVAAVPDERWASPSPCQGWAALDVVQADLDDPQRAAAEFDGYVGRTTFEQQRLSAFLGRRS